MSWTSMSGKTALISGGLLLGWIALIPVSTILAAPVWHVLLSRSLLCVFFSSSLVWTLLWLGPKLPGMARWLQPKLLAMPGFSLRLLRALPAFGLQLLGLTASTWAALSALVALLSTAKAQSEEEDYCRDNDNIASGVDYDIPSCMSDFDAGSSMTEDYYDYYVGPYEGPR